MNDLLADQPIDTGLTAQIMELRRELGMRQRVYPNLIAKGSLTEADADYQTTVMQAALATLQARKDAAENAAKLIDTMQRAKNICKSVEAGRLSAADTLMLTETLRDLRAGIKLLQTATGAQDG
ncbi:MAG: hypothetical protein QNI84_13245 [Henriciella sp.]|nr:hypothetical protein [Henriciella sp.]